MIYNSITELIGNTPLIRLNNLAKKYDLKADLLVKAEYFNPTGSIKDRAALNMIDDALKKGKINKDTVIIEPTSGNTGIGLACVARAYKMKCIIVMPDSMSVERRNFLKAYGAELVLSDGKLGMTGAINKAKELNNEIKNSIVAGQFVNMANMEAHYKTTGPEIWNDTLGKVDIVVMGVGTGGTISGVSKYLKEKNPNIKIVAVEPATSAVLSGLKAGAHKIQGIGAGFIPEVLNINSYDSILPITDEDSYNMVYELSDEEGIFVGISSGAALKGAIIEASKEENKGKTIIAILPDSGDRYLSVLY